MAPRSSQDEPAAEPAPPAEAVDLMFVYQGEIGMLEQVDVKTKLSGVRLLVREALGTHTHPMDIKLFNLRRPDGSWPDEDETPGLEGTKVKYACMVKSQFPKANVEGAIHFRVELGTTMTPTPTPADDGNESDGGLSDAADGIKAMNEAVASSRKRRASSNGNESLPFHMFNAATVTKMYKKIRVETYVQLEEELPEELQKNIQKAYSIAYNSIGPFTDKSEECKVAYINTILLPCVAQVNTKSGLSGDSRLDVDMQVTLCAENLNSSGRADYVISKGTRRMVVIEAKDANIREGIAQTKATMEAARILNKMVRREWNTVKAICTDMQNWAFIERSSGLVRQETKLNGCDLSTDTFPPELWPMVRKMYKMLLDL